MSCVQTDYVSAACNRNPCCAVWGESGIVYGFGRSIAVFAFKNGHSGPGEIISILNGHRDHVKCVDLLKDSKNSEKVIVSGASDGECLVWQRNDKTWLQACRFKAHDGALTSICAIPWPSSTSEDEILIITGGIDSNLKIWRVNKENAELVQTFNFRSGFVLDLSICIVPRTEIPLLACGSDNQTIVLYKWENEKFVKLTSLIGHEDWVRGLDFAIDEKGDILLASCSQDKLIRVWRLSSRRESQNEPKTSRRISDLAPTEEIAMKETIVNLSVDDAPVLYAVCLESVMFGHENWVYSVKWQPSFIEDGKYVQPMRLLSASMDKTMILWTTDPESGVWVEQVRVGDVGGNSLGFFGGLFSPCGQSILSHGYQGAFTQWTYYQETHVWEPQVTGGGHFQPVVDLCWCGDDGQFLLSASLDQTTRLHAPWRYQEGQCLWYEIARPQVHGYDLQCLASLGKYKFASGADEKIVRVFSAPKNFITNFCNLCGHDAQSELLKDECSYLPVGANVPALGLSNKAVFIGEEQNKPMETEKPGQYPENYFTPVDLTSPPTEDQLLQNTLWPEEGKLYGHGYEIFSLAAHPSGELLASACKAAKSDSANILLWDMKTKKIVSSLLGCSLTVTQMAFSHDGKFLLAVSRDRSWALFEQRDNGNFSLAASIDKKISPHARIIWSCCWSHDDKYFFTASRDKKLLVWDKSSVCCTSQPCHISSLVLSDSVTAVTTTRFPVKRSKYLLAAGLDCGQILIFLFSPVLDGGDGSDWTLVTTLTDHNSHTSTVTKLQFRPCKGRAGKEDDGHDCVQLASCSTDHSLRIYSLNTSMF